MTSLGEPLDRSAPVPAPAAHVRTAVFDAETVLYDAEQSRPVLLNVSAAAVWALLDGRRTLADLAAIIADRFAAEPARVAPDVAAAVARFRALGLLDDDHPV